MVSYPLDYSKEFKTVEEAVMYAEKEINKKALEKKDEYVKEIKSYVLLSKDTKTYNKKLKTLYMNILTRLLVNILSYGWKLQELYLNANIDIRKEVFLAPFTLTYDRIRVEVCY